MEKKAVRAAYGEALVKLGEKNDRVVVLDADLASATMTGTFKKAFPERFYDCGIAEANMVDMAAGISTMGLIPFCSTFAVFAGRNYDQIRNGVCYPKFNVKFGFSHAGITLGEDGRDAGQTDGCCGRDGGAALQKVSAGKSFAHMSPSFLYY